MADPRLVPELLESLTAGYNDAFGRAPERLFFCPGRVNVIGEHLDYNGGLVLPAAIQLGIYALYGLSDEPRIELRSASERDVAQLALSEEGRLADSVDLSSLVHWARYPAGVIKYLQNAQSPALQGSNILFGTTLPTGAGLSSSAALEVLTAYMVQTGAFSGSPRTELDQRERREIALLCQRVENEVLGVKCGIMDQYSVACGKAGSALLLDCNRVESELIPAAIPGYTFYVMNSKKRRALTESRYNQRRTECDEALAMLRTTYDLQSLSQAPLEALTSLQPDVLHRRARHVITEQARVVGTADALRRNDIQAVGMYLRESHESLRADFEVTGPELDALVESAWAHPGCIGARMTGAGFGGCCIALVNEAAHDDFRAFVSQRYSQRTGIQPELYPVAFVEGVSELRWQ